MEYSTLGVKIHFGTQSIALLPSNRGGQVVAVLSNGGIKNFEIAFGGAAGLRE
jgi:hypothetical protein